MSIDKSYDSLKMYAILVIKGNRKVYQEKTIAILSAVRKGGFFLLVLSHFRPFLFTPRRFPE